LTEHSIGAQGGRAVAGALSLSAGVLVFSFQDLIVKWVAGTYPIHEVIVLRSLVAMPLLVLFVRVELGGLMGIRSRRWGALLLRGTILLVCYIAFYLSLPAMPLASAVALSFSSPLFIAALAGPMLGERVGVARWIAVLVGFAGAVVIIRPDGGVLEPAALLPLLSALTYAVGQILARRLGVTEASSVMATYQNGAFILIGGAMAVVLGGGRFAAEGHPSVEFLLRGWVMPPAFDLAILLAGGLVAGTGAFLLTHAYRIAEANVIAPFEYTSLIWASAWGYFVWGETLEPRTILGMAMILGASLYVLRKVR
jgi:drug/metabolite transporter (DMT)-like permease